jgi:hypothetical protein
MKDAEIWTTSAPAGASPQSQSNPSRRLVVDHETSMRLSITASPLGSGQMTLRKIYYALFLAGLLLLLFCVNSFEWLISKFQLALLSVFPGLAFPGHGWRSEAATDEIP